MFGQAIKDLAATPRIAPGIRNAILAAGLVAATLPTAAAAQYRSDGSTFLQGVRDRDGDEVTKLLVDKQAAVIDTRDMRTGEGALHIVARRRDSAWLGFLLAQGARPDLRDGEGNTPLLIAATIGFSEGVDTLLKRGANVDLANNTGETPLIRAVQARDLDTVRLLVAAGADPARRDAAAGLSARDYAARDTRSSVILKVLEEAKPKAKATMGPSL